MPVEASRCAMCERPGAFSRVATKAHGKLPLCEDCKATCERNHWLAEAA
jgi:NAD-dependent SIR2 family protein deacetylase